MNVKFQDFYGQQVMIHNETSSGNIRIEVRTMPNMNDLRTTTVADYSVVTDISLDENTAMILLGALKKMMDYQNDR